MKHTCTHCQVTTTEDITIQTDFKAIKQNVIEVLKYKTAWRLYELNILHYNNHISNYRRIAACHNESKHFWQYKWIVVTSTDILTFPKTEEETRIVLSDGWNNVEASSEWPPFYKPTTPTLVKLPTQYIECPVCKFRHYIE